MNYCEFAVSKEVSKDCQSDQYLSGLSKEPTWVVLNSSGYAKTLLLGRFLMTILTDEVLDFSTTTEILCLPIFLGLF